MSRDGGIAYEQILVSPSSLSSVPTRLDASVAGHLGVGVQQNAFMHR